MGKITFSQEFCPAEHCFRDPNKNTDSSWVPSTGRAYWPIHSSIYREYLEISTNITMGKGWRAKECVFWTKYLPQLLRKGDTRKRKNIISKHWNISAEEPLLQPASNSCPTGECICHPTASCNCPTSSSSTIILTLLAILSFLLLLAVIL